MVANKAVCRSATLLLGEMDHEPSNHITEEEHCLICLQKIADRTILPACSHDVYCFQCLLVWLKQSKKCPLCSVEIGPFVIHSVRSKNDYQRHYITPILSPKSPTAETRRQRQLRERELLHHDEMENALHRRRFIYQYNLYAKHIGSNKHSGYRPHPSPAQVSASQDLQSKAAAFLRRELRVWVNVDVEFLTNYIVTLIKMLDLRSEAGIKLLCDLIDPGIQYSEETRKPNSEHLAHELYSFLRSPYKNLDMYDKVVQYEDITTSPGSGRAESSRRRPYSTHRTGRFRSPRRDTEQTGEEKYDGGHLKRRRDRSRSLDGEEAHKWRRVSSNIKQSSLRRSPIASSQDLTQAETHYKTLQTRNESKTPPPETPIAGRNRPNTYIQKAPRISTFESMRAHLSLATGERKEVPRQIDLVTQAQQPRELGAMTSSFDTLNSSPEQNDILRRVRQELAQELATDKVNKQMEHAEHNRETVVDDGINVRGAATKAKSSALHDLEAKLRSRAILRARIAKEKSQISESGILAQPDSSQICGIGLEGVEGPEIIASKLKEKLLRERLLMNRNKATLTL